MTYFFQLITVELIYKSKCLKIIIFLSVILSETAFKVYMQNALINICRCNGIEELPVGKKGTHKVSAKPPATMQIDQAVQVAPVPVSAANVRVVP